MDYREFVIHLPREKVDLVSAFLVGRGFDTFEVVDFSDLLDTAGQMFYDYVEDDLLQKQQEPPVIKFYSEPEDDLSDRLAAAMEECIAAHGWTDVSCEARLVTGSDWDTKWKEFFKPFPLGERLWIQPSWEKADPASVGERRILEIDPAAAFGSGSHATTRLCLLGIDREVRGGESVLDMGCGSGILGIAAAKLGAARIVAVDIDEAACRTARENFLVNGIEEERFEVFCGDVLSDRALPGKIGGPFDLVAANIVAGIIREMAPYLFSVLKPGGVLLASGILNTREAEVKEALTAAGFTLAGRDSEEDWICLKLTK